MATKDERGRAWDLLLPVLNVNDPDGQTLRLALARLTPADAALVRRVDRESPGWLTLAMTTAMFLASS